MLALVRTNSWTAVISSWLAGQKYFTHLQGSVNGMTRLIIGPATPVPTVKPVRKVKIRSRNICFFVANKRKNFSKLIVNIHPRHSYKMVDCLKNNLSHGWHWCARTYVSMNVYTTMWMLRALGFVVAHDLLEYTDTWMTSRWTCFLCFVQHGAPFVRLFRIFNKQVKAS